MTSNIVLDTTTLYLVSFLPQPLSVPALHLISDQLIYFWLKTRVQLGDHDLGPLLDGLKTPTDYVLAGKD